LVRVYFDPAFLKHETGNGHPESSERLKAVISVARDMSEIEIVGQCPAASVDDICLVHSRSYVTKLSRLKTDSHIMLDPDTSFSAGTMEAALKSVGAVIEAVKYVCESDGNRAFCAVRPPGHHAEQDRAMGFCIFNNISIGAAYALKNGYSKRVAIIDWDVHHGNGTQLAFYDNHNVLYISLHQANFYPGTGHVFETGGENAKGLTINLPMRAGASDQDYQLALEEIVLPAIDNFEPDMLFISAGFDAHRDDPLANINLSTEYFGEMTRLLVGKANQYCRGRIVSVLEGGYNLNALTHCARLHFEELKND
jgi:acetoin utilization deacetylase AcuC-like enzyme